MEVTNMFTEKNVQELKKNHLLNKCVKIRAM